MYLFLLNYSRYIIVPVSSLLGVICILKKRLNRHLLKNKIYVSDIVWAIPSFCSFFLLSFFLFLFTPFFLPLLCLFPPLLCLFPPLLCLFPPLLCLFSSFLCLFPPLLSLSLFLSLIFWG